jgi:hypothetical protein
VDLQNREARERVLQGEAERRRLDTSIQPNREGPNNAKFYFGKNDKSPGLET